MPVHHRRHFLCPTRWTVRTASLSSVVGNYSSLIQTLDNIYTECRDDLGAKASGFLRRLQGFDTLFGLRVALLVIWCSNLLRNALKLCRPRVSPQLMPKELLRQQQTCCKNCASISSLICSTINVCKMLNSWELMNHALDGKFVDQNVSRAAGNSTIQKLLVISSTRSIMNLLIPSLFASSSDLTIRRMHCFRR